MIKKIYYGNILSFFVFFLPCGDSQLSISKESYGQINQIRYGWFYFHPHLASNQTELTFIRSNYVQSVLPGVSPFRSKTGLLGSSENGGQKQKFRFVFSFKSYVKYRILAFEQWTVCIASCVKRSVQVSQIFLLKNRNKYMLNFKNHAANK